MSLATRFADAMAALWPAGPPDRLAVAFSGGGDSTALLALCRDWLPQAAQLDAVIVDHGLRPTSPDEARLAAERAGAIGAQSHILTLPGWDGHGNLQDMARKGRYRVMADWAVGQSPAPAAIAVGHSLDDQAETVLLRLARGSGVDGLAGMASVRWMPDGPPIHRPLLQMTRAELRDWLRARKLDWIEDPSNDDARFDRIRMRKAMPDLARLGLTADRLALTATAMGRAQTALNAHAAEVARRSVRDGGAWLDIAPDLLANAEDETRLRLLSAAVRYVGGAVYRPRLSSMAVFHDHVMAGRGATLAGVCATPWRGRVVLHREYRAVRDLGPDLAGLWDGRWQVATPLGPGQTLAALGAHGVPALGDMDRPVPHACLIALPAVWQGGLPVAVPHLGWPDGGPSLGRVDRRDFAAFLFAH